jgi:hypothetical protein
MVKFVASRVVRALPGLGSPTVQKSRSACGGVKVQFAPGESPSWGGTEGLEHNPAERVG